jgi:N-carbamoylputrescine amidase
MEKEERLIKLGLIQTDCEKDPSVNILKSKELIRQAADQGANIICLQELFTTLYFCNTHDENNFNMAEKLDSAFVYDLCSLCSELGIVLIAPFFEKRAQGLYHNSLVVIDVDGTLLGHYRKMHIPDDPGFHEKYYFAPGDEESGFKVFNTKFGRIGTLICWDQWYPEAARINALKGAEIIFYPTAIGILKKESRKQKKIFKDAWITIQRSHAIANGCFVASVNRVGKEGGNKFWGNSFVAGPFGEIIKQGGEKEEIIIAEIDLETIEGQRREWPFFRDRRIDMYDGVLKRMIDEVQ